MSGKHGGGEDWDKGKPGLAGRMRSCARKIRYQCGIGGSESTGPVPSKTAGDLRNQYSFGMFIRQEWNQATRSRSIPGAR
jgi:hypothetical protein